jgi:hypothetical protein
MVGVNSFILDADLQKALADRHHWDSIIPQVEYTDVFPSESFFKVRGLLPVTVAALLRIICQARQWQAVGLDGYADKPVDKIGNYRLSNYNEELADLLWKRIRLFLPTVRTMEACTPTDHDGHARWRPVGVNPLFRFIRYDDGGQLVAHYDAAYEESTDRRTLMSVVIYQTTNASGATRFLKDPQAGKPMSDMDFSDWDRVGTEDEILLRNQPTIGDAIIFDHRLLHDGEYYKPGNFLSDKEKVIIRTDIMFEKVHEDDIGTDERPLNDRDY